MRSPLLHNANATPPESVNIQLHPYLDQEKTQLNKEKNADISHWLVNMKMSSNEKYIHLYTDYEVNISPKIHKLIGWNPQRGNSFYTQSFIGCSHHSSLNFFKSLNTVILQFHQCLGCSWMNSTAIFTAFEATKFNLIDIYGVHTLRQYPPF